MANRNDIMQEVNLYKNAGQDIIRRKYLEELQKYTTNDTIIYAASSPCSILGMF